MTSVSDSQATPAVSGGTSLRELVRALSAFAPDLAGDGSVCVSSVQQDSRRVRAGDLFVARSGKHADGARFVIDAVGRGARAVLAARGADLGAVALPVVRVNELARALAFAAEHVYGAPSQRLALVGITGTNGKTTTSFLVEQALARLGRKPARLGTLGFAFGGESEESALTTPEADAISERLSHVVANGGTHCVMEVSSVALELERVAALSFEVAAFSNLTQDHLDFHGTMSAYGAAKAKLFRALSPRHAVLNVDDAFGRELAASLSGSVLRVSQRASAELSVLRSEFSREGTVAEVSWRGSRSELKSRLVGAHNLDNLLLALGVLLALGEDLTRAAAALAECAGVPGRLERCDEPGDEQLVAVDYAHTPDALERALAALRPLTSGRLICVFGCGGDRDPLKRPLMGAAAAEGADYVIVSNDNPRTEEPSQIARAIVPAIAERGTPYEVELDRTLAIQRAIDLARSGDSVLIAGKGHENYQIFGTEKRPFDDRDEARRALRMKREGRL